MRDASEAEAPPSGSPVPPESIVVDAPSSVGSPPRRRAPFLLPPRIAVVRSLWIKVLLVVAAVAVSPQLLVLAWALLDRNVARDMEVRVSFSADEAARALEGKGEIGPETSEAVHALALVHHIRIRVLRGSATVVDADEDRGTDLLQRIGTLFLGDDEAPTLAGFDATLPPVATRPEVSRALTTGAASGCEASTGGKLLVCYGARTLGNPSGEAWVVYVQESSRRAVRALYDLRYHLLRLSLVTLPLALALAYWMGKRVVGPIEELRRQALAWAGADGPIAKTPPLAVRGQDEITDLAAAFNMLLVKLEHRQGENERFVADLVHEFKNPVAAVRAAAEALTHGTVDEARARRLGKVLLDSSTRLNALVSQFLELARAEAGLASEERVEVDLGALAHGLVEAIRPRYEAVELTVNADADARVFGVPHSLDTLLRNLIENAVSFALPAADTPARVLVTVLASDTGVVVRVTDSGPGIAPDDLDRVFTRFFTTRGRSRGTGLGLALVRATAEAHGGTVSVASEPGRGATFEIVLPRRG